MKKTDGIFFLAEAQCASFPAVSGYSIIVIDLGSKFNYPEFEPRTCQVRLSTELSTMHAALEAISPVSTSFQDVHWYQMCARVYFLSQLA